MRVISSIFIPVRVAIMVVRSFDGTGAVVVKVGAWGVLSSGEGVRAQWGMVSGLVVSIGTDSGAEGKGVGDGADEWQTGVVGVESASISISVWASDASLPGGGIVRSRIVTFFFFFLGFEILRGKGFAALGVRMARLSSREASLSLTVWMAAFDLFFNR